MFNSEHRAPAIDGYTVFGLPRLRGEFHTVLVDVGRDHARGLDLCRSLHAEPETRSIPLIAITGDATIGRLMMTMRVMVCDADTLSHEINGLIS